jgi:hypothetical protein
LNDIDKVNDAVPTKQTLNSERQNSVNVFKEQVKPEPVKQQKV